MANAQTYTVALPAFEGPLELLLDLIEKRELEVTELAISQVTGDYLAAISALEKVHDDDLYWFLEIGTKLISYKTRAIRRDNTDNETDESDADIASQIARYQVWRGLASELQRLFANPLATRGQSQNAPQQKPIRYANFTLEDLRSAWLQIYAQKSPKIRRQRISVTRHDLEKTMQKLLNRLNQRHDMRSALDKSNRHALALSFLALLELIKRDLIEIVFEQDTTYVKAI